MTAFPVTTPPCTGTNEILSNSPKTEEDAAVDMVDMHTLPTAEEEEEEVQVEGDDEEKAKATDNAKLDKHNVFNTLR